MYIDTEKKFSSRRIVEMAKSRWPHIFDSQVLLDYHYICSLTCHLVSGRCESKCVCSLYPKNQLPCCHPLLYSYLSSIWAVIFKHCVPTHP